MIKTIVLAGTYFFWLPSLTALGAPGQDSIKSAADTVLQNTQSVRAGDQFYNVFLMTAVLLLILVSGAYIYKKLGGKSKFIGKSNVRILSRFHLGPKQSIVIAIIENKKYALGVTEQSVNVIADLGETVESETAEEDAKTQSGNFSSILNLLKKNKS